MQDKTSNDTFRDFNDVVDDLRRAVCHWDAPMDIIPLVHSFSDHQTKFFCYMFGAGKGSETRVVASKLLCELAAAAGAGRWDEFRGLVSSKVSN